MMSFEHRHCEPELMDDPDLDPTLHHQALKGLERVNWISRSIPTIWNPIRKLAATCDGRTLRVLDVACGGGDTVIKLWKRANQSGHRIEVDGCDISPTAVAYATSQAADENVPARFFQADAIGGDLPADYDVVISTLFLHHLSESDAMKLLSNMRDAAGRMVLISDLIRSRLGYVLAWCGLRLLTRSHICHHDGALSVRAAFTPEEALAIAGQANLDGARLTHHWPQRFVLTWSRP